MARCRNASIYAGFWVNTLGRKRAWKNVQFAHFVTDPRQSLYLCGFPWLNLNKIHTQGDAVCSSGYLATISPRNTHIWLCLWQVLPPYSETIDRRISPLILYLTHHKIGAICVTNFVPLSHTTGHINSTLFRDIICTEFSGKVSL